jgi:hypothetical protein
MLSLPKPLLALFVQIFSQLSFLCSLFLSFLLLSFFSSFLVIYHFHGVMSCGSSCIVFFYFFLAKLLKAKLK